MKKTLIWFPLLASMLLLRCGQANEEQKTPEPQTHIAFENPAGEATTDQCVVLGSLDANNCGGERKVKDSCAIAWQAAWDPESLGLDSMSQVRSFEKTALQQFLNTCDDCNAVRIYFGWHHHAKKGHKPGLSLTLVNVDADCNEKLTGQKPVLVCMTTNDWVETTHPQDTATSSNQSNRWSEKLYEGDNPSYLKVTSYTHPRSAIQKAIDNSTTHVNMFAAVHQVSRAHVEELYCFPAGTETARVVDLVILGDKENAGGKDWIDFARPCPQYCSGNGARLNNTACN